MNPIAIIITAGVLEAAAMGLVLFVVAPAMGWSLPAWVPVLVYGVWGGYEILTFGPKARALGQPSRFGPDNLNSKTGVALSPIHKDGKVRIGREIWRAQSTHGPIAKGAEVEIVERRGLLLVVQMRGQRAAKTEAA